MSTNTECQQGVEGGREVWAGVWGGGESERARGHYYPKSPGQFCKTKKLFCVLCQVSVTTAFSLLFREKEEKEEKGRVSGVRGARRKQRKRVLGQKKRKENEPNSPKSPL